jgi:hypothetical protein
VIGLIGVLIFSAGVSKALAPLAYLEAVKGYRLLPDRAVFPVGVAILVLEIVFGAILWVPRWRWWSLPGAIGLLLLFAGVMTATLVNQLPADCGCQLPFLGEAKVSWWLVGRNVLLVLGLVGAQFVASHPGSSWRDVRERIANQAGALLVLGVFGLMALAILQLHQKTNLLQDHLVRVLRQPPLLRRGETVTPFRAIILPDQREETISFAEKESTFLFVFSPHCPHCRQALSRLNEQAERMPAGVQLLGVTLGTPSGTEQYLKEHPARFPVCAPTDLENVVQEYRLFTFPQVIEIGRDGKVLAVRRGAGG